MTHAMWNAHAGTGIALHSNNGREKKKKRTGGARHVNMSSSLGSGMGEGGEGTLLVGAT